jgi:hypothetical protein
VSHYGLLLGTDNTLFIITTSLFGVIHFVVVMLLISRLGRENFFGEIIRFYIFSGIQAFKQYEEISGFKATMSISS